MDPPRLQTRESSMSRNSRVKLESLNSRRTTMCLSRNNTQITSGPGPPTSRLSNNNDGFSSRQSLEPTRSNTKVQIITSNRSNSKLPLVLTSSRYALPKLNGYAKSSGDVEWVENDSKADGKTNYKQRGKESNKTTKTQDVLKIARQLTREFTFANYSLSRGVSGVTPINGDPWQLEKSRYIKCYEEACRRLKTPPVASIKRSLTEPVLALKSYYLGEAGTRTLAIALVNNRIVSKLDLTDNWLTASGAKHIAKMLCGNSYITELNLSENGIGSVGNKAICDAVMISPNITILNLSHNGLRDADAKFIKDLLKINRKVKELILSHNQFREAGGISLGKALIFNESLALLDISWNHLRGKGAVGLCNGLLENNGIKQLNLSWNGFGAKGCKALGRALASHRTLTHLDISCNRIDTDAVGPFLKGLVKNDSIHVLRMSRNQLPSKVVTALLTAIVQSDLPIVLLDLKDIEVDNEFTDLVKETQLYRPLTVLHGPVMRVNKGVEKGEENTMSTNPIAVFFTHMNKKGLRITDLFKRYDEGKRDKFIITAQQFKDGIRSVQIPLTEGSMEQIIEKIGDKRGRPDLVKLMEEEKVHRKKLLNERMKKMNPPKRPIH